MLKNNGVARVFKNNEAACVLENNDFFPTNNSINISQASLRYWQHVSLKYNISNSVTAYDVDLEHFFSAAISITDLNKYFNTAHFV